MRLDVALSIAMLGATLWALGFMLPRAVKTREPVAIASAVLTAFFALLGWLLIGVAASTGSGAH